jgi:hypothetical protein
MPPDPLLHNLKMQARAFRKHLTLFRACTALGLTSSYSFLRLNVEGHFKENS